MIVYFLTKQKDVCDYLAHLLKQSGHEVSVYTDSVKFYADVKELGSREIDVLAIDYRMFEHDYFDPYKVMVEHECIIPLIYYNDPYPEPENRAIYWKVKNHDHIGAFLPPKKLDEVMVVFRKLQQLVNVPELNQYISLINRPREFNFDALDSGDFFSIEQFRKNNHLPESRYKLLTYLYQHRGQPLSVDSLCSFLWKNVTDAKRHTLYTYIHELRAVLEKEKQVQLKIEHDGKERYRLVVMHPLTMCREYLCAADYFKRDGKSPVVFKTVDQKYLMRFKTNSTELREQ